MGFECLLVQLWRRRRSMLLTLTTILRVLPEEHEAIFALLSHALEQCILGKVTRAGAYWRTPISDILLLTILQSLRNPFKLLASGDQV